MDKSKTYIKMCEKAKEIQQLAPSPTYEDKEFWHIDDDGDNTWLPRQDQLQEMVKRGNAKFHPYNLLWRLMRFAHNSFDCTTMEQLWLAFVMKEKYNKTWNGEDWIQRNKL